MPSLDAVLAELRAAIPGCVAAGVADPRTGALVAARAEDGDARAALARAVGAAGTLLPFADAPLDFEEVVVRGDDAVHIVQRCGDKVLVTVCRGAVSVGRILVEARARRREVEAAA